jgi:urate oxidase
MSQPTGISRQSYGKSRVRLTKVTRHHDSQARHDLREIAVDILLEGDFEASYLDGDNRNVVPTDTMKNTVYAMAAEHPLDSLESFGLTLIDHFLFRHAHVSAVTVAIEETPWRRIEGPDGSHHPHAFIAAGLARRTCRVRGDRGAPTVEAGVSGLTVVKTTDSAFRDFARNEYTTLPDKDDRIFGTVVEAQWRYRTGTQPDWNAVWVTACRTMVDVFAAHRSLAVQQTLYEMGQAALAGCGDMEEITMEMPNQHRIPVDLTPFGLSNTNSIFVTTSEPYGLIQATLCRKE